MLIRWSLLIVATIGIAAVARADNPPSAAGAAKIDFARDVRPILARACYSCHGPSKQKSGLRLDQKADAFRGGDLGKAIIPGKAADSPLVRYVAGLDADILMPPKGDRLSSAEVNVLRSWIDQGATWPEAADGSVGAVWWSFRPITRPPVPVLSGEDSRWVRTPVDAFVVARMREKGLRPSPEADRRTLIRRLTFDLTGLPPTPAEVDAFLNDREPNAYERLVDRLLESPHYGERWARHWLDVVHYGDTHGYDKDQPRPNAWPYRDYVIRAFNEDRQYARFVQEQLAGDVLFAGSPDGIEALGFISAGPWDLIGHAEVPETKTDGKIARHLDRDDMVTNTMMTFASLTVQCAQCHNHKFDPITQEDYYSLQAVFAALDRADRRYYRDPAIARQAAELEQRRAGVTVRKKVLEAKMTQLVGPKLGELDRQIAGLSTPAPGGERPEFGYHSGIEPRQDVVKWVQVDLGKSVAVDQVEYVGCHDTFNNIGAGFGFPVRFKIEASDDPEFKHGVTLLLDQTARDVPNPGVVPQRAPANGKRARYIRVTATKLAPRLNDYIFALAELSVFDQEGKNVSAGAPVTALDSIEAPPRWRKANLVDGYYFGRTGPKDAAVLAGLRKQRQELFEKAVPAAVRDEIDAVDRQLASIQAEVGRLPPASIVYVGTIHTGSGAFSGTGPFGGRPRRVHVLKRGDVRQPLQEVGPGAINSVAGMPGRFGIAPDRPEGDRRAALALWLTDPRNPLTWRSAVNRVWRYHFGRGIVDSPNDFGKMGQLPTHPDLLDWLAVEFRDRGQSFKQLHKLLVTSATYRQASRPDEAAARIDADNAYYWRMNRRRLEAEEVRDALLAVSGRLDPRMGGAAFQDFLVEKPEHSPHYQYHLADPDDPRTHRRSVYRFLVRSQQQPFMSVLDCADPSMQVDKRNETLSALQALALLNNGFMLTMSKHFAERLEHSAGDLSGQVAAAYHLAFAREPSADEQTKLTAYARRHGLANACRLIFNLNEFVFVD